MIEVLALDFDGVVVESLDVKTQAFAAIFADRRQHLDTILKLHRENGGMTRFKKFEIIYRDILKEPLTSEESAALGERFERWVVDRVVACEPVRGSVELLRRWSPRLPIYVISATPHEEMRTIAAARGLTPYFADVFGSPTTKPEWLRHILARHNLAPERVLFVGDAHQDAAAAAETGVRFVRRYVPGLDPTFAGLPIQHTVADLAGLDTYLTEVLGLRL